MGTSELAKILITIGLVILALGVLVRLFGESLLGLGRLPGDILIKRGNFTLYIPITTSIIISLLLTLLAALFRR